jgi:polysaccharide pyruvyl transferase WcaK-like protein
VGTVSNLQSELLSSSSAETTFFNHLTKVAAAGKARGNHSRTLDVRSGKPQFRPLLVGYNGAANTGADVRVIEMLRQFEVIFGHLDYQPILMIAGNHFDHPVFERIQKTCVKGYFPDFLSESAHTYNGSIVCEGSMFTSTFSDGLAGMFAGTLGYAAALGDLSVGYGAEASTMSPALENFVRDSCKDSLVIARTAKSAEILTGLDIRTKSGADTAWAFEPLPDIETCPFRKAGWNGSDKLAALCPINPFCWPIVVDVERAKATRSIRDEHQFGEISFHSWSTASEQKYSNYLAGFVALVQWMQSHHYFPVMVGMQDLDKSTCLRLNACLHSKIPLFVRGSSTVDEIVSILHKSDMIVSSRYHATVLGISGGTPTIGVSMDSRIHSLFVENNLEEWVVQCDTEFLGERLIERVHAAQSFRHDLADKYSAITANQIRAFGQMGIDLLDEAIATYENVPPSPLARSWDLFLPPLSTRIQTLLTQYT